MVFKKWRLRPADKALAKQLAQECDIDPFVALIATAREYTDPLYLEEFLSAEPMVASPYDLADIEKAAERINIAIEQGEKIAVFGDYDCDGISATVLLYSYLHNRGADVLYFIPSREKDGYGINSQAVENLAAKGVQLIITVDNGIHAVAEAEQASSLGIDFIVTDHHLPQEQLPNAYAVVDPYVSPSCEFKSLAGVGVAFKLLCVLEQAEPEELLEQYADIVTIGTIADVMPLLEDNRSVVKAGLSQINRNPRVGIAALLEVAGLSDKTITAGNMAFSVTPRLNASGRMGDAQRAVELLLSTDYDHALALAKELDAENSNRQKIEQQILQEAVEKIEVQNLQYDRVIVVSGTDWHHGVIGIVASRIVELYGKPAIVLSVQDGVASGSGRSVSGFHLFNALQQTQSLLQRFGGHESAAGLGILEQDIPAFREQINQYARSLALPAPEIVLDCKLNPVALSTDLVYALADMEPFGTGNPTPLFGLFEMRLDKIQELAQGKHLRLTLSKNGTVVNVLAFGKTKARFGFAIGNVVDLAVALSINVYNGQETLSVLLKDIRMHGLDDQLVINQCALFDDYKKDILSADAVHEVLPGRDELGAIFRYIRNFTMPISADLIVQQFILQMSRAKIGVILDVLCELGVIKIQTSANTTMYVCAECTQKNSMENSFILKKLSALKGEMQ